MLIELRIRPGKFKITSLIEKVAEEFHLSSRKSPRIPHLTLYGNFNTDKRNIPRVVKILEDLGKKHDSIPFVIDGFSRMKGEKGWVIYFKIVPSKELDDLRNNLIHRLEEFAPSSKPFDDLDVDFVPHITLCFRLSDREADRIWSYLESPPKEHPEYRPPGKFYFPMESMRLTFLGNNRRIICEYDMIQKKTFDRTDSLSKGIWRKTMEEYRLLKGFEVTKKTRSSKPRTFLVSDLHLDHGNIIRYCIRPFTNYNDMNKVIVDNWNNTVGTKDIVYFLGDMSFGRDSKSAEYWVKKLNGNIIFVPGNHDRGFEDAQKYQILEHGKTKFLLVHDPNELPIEWGGWIIHGDKHNNDLRNYPFVNWEKKTVNVSLEVIGYKPIEFEKILKAIEKKETIISASVPL